MIILTGIGQTKPQDTQEDLQAFAREIHRATRDLKPVSVMVGSKRSASQANMSLYIIDVIADEATKELYIRGVGSDMILEGVQAQAEVTKKALSRYKGSVIHLNYSNMQMEEHPDSIEFVIEGDLRSTRISFQKNEHNRK